MTERRYWRRLGCAALMSGAVHAALIAFGRIELPSEPAALPPLAVRLERAEVRPATSPPPHTAPKKPRRAPGIPIRPAPDFAALPGPMTAPEEADAPPAEIHPVVEMPAAEPVVVATAPASTLQPEPAPLPSFPRRGRLSFSLVYGRDAIPVGRTEQSWQIDGTRYQLASRSETTGLADLLRSQHRTYVSRGELTAQGLRPEIFEMSRNRGRGPEAARAQFDWAEGSVVLGPSNAPRTQSLPPGSQDLVSFMYQLAIDPPPPGPRSVAVTNGTRLEVYELVVGSEEKIETPIGILRALPIRQVREPGNESVELWLATEYRHLPVRLRFYGRDGEPTGEQVVTEIRLSDE